MASSMAMVARHEGPALRESRRISSLVPGAHGQPVALQVSEAYDDGMFMDAEVYTPPEVAAVPAPAAAPAPSSDPKKLRGLKDLERERQAKARHPPCSSLAACFSCSCVDLRCMTRARSFKCSATVWALPCNIRTGEGGAEVTLPARLFLVAVVKPTGSSC